ncbi:MAG: TVP38/TMEM64 family protein, partial [Promethearchaeota archaeon]
MKNEKKKPFSERLKSYIKNLLDFSQYDAKTILYMIIFMFLIVISLYLLYYIYFVDETFLFRLVVEWFVNPIILLGIFGIILFLVIMTIQGLIVPIPSEIVLLAAGMIWGWLWGGLLGIAGSMLAAILCFYVSRKGGRPLAEKFVGESALEMADDLIEKHGMIAIILARSLPFISFDAISYTAGLVDMDIKKYSIGTLIGTIPRAFFYSYLGFILIKHEPGQPIDLEDIPLKEIELLSQTFN